MKISYSNQEENYIVFVMENGKNIVFVMENGKKEVLAI